MKPFNLEDALAGAPVVQRNGLRAKILGAPGELRGITFQVMGIREVETDRWSPASWTLNGSYYDNQGMCDNDLFMVPTKKTLYCVVVDKSLENGACVFSFKCPGDRDVWVCNTNHKIYKQFEIEYEDEE